jgi:uncharacterized protein YlzI (FlbEa/FlbD family)
VSIKAASMISLDQPVSLAPLAKLPNLKKVWINAGRIEDVEALLEAPSLEAIELPQHVIVVGDDREKVNEKIRARGIATSL